MFFPTQMTNHFALFFVTVNNDNMVCSFPEWMNKHRDWRAVGDELLGLLPSSSSTSTLSGGSSGRGMASSSMMHVAKRGHSLKFKYHTTSSVGAKTSFDQKLSSTATVESQATCHKLDETSEPHKSKIVAHVKSGW